MNRLKLNSLLFLGCLLVKISLAGEPVLKFSADKRFKIVQFTDTHIKPSDKESLVAINMINKVLVDENPDLVVFTGDVVTDNPVAKGWEMATEPLIKRQIPFAVVFGNHDDESELTREQIASIVVKIPGCLFVPQIKGVFGFGNYILPIKSSTGISNSALLYCMDSNAYSTVKEVKGYGWFQASQINWYRSESQKQKEANGKTIPALAFFHIPLPEYEEAYKNEKYPPIGLRLEKECSPEVNSGMFSAMLECGDVMATFVGHDHSNDYVAYLYGIALAYGRFSGGKTTYSDLQNGARIIELIENERSFKTWIRTLKGDILLPVSFPTDFLKTK
jgi:Predicted phosphohydrolases